jgi:short-subunit dehydrogenase
MPLEQKRIVVTGASGGLGQSVMRRLSSAGARLCVVGRRVDAFAGAEHVKADLSTAGGIAEAAGMLAASPTDILLNLAGIQYFGPFEHEAPAHVQATFMVNLIAPVLLAQAALPGMKSRGSGQIVNVGSVFGSINYAHFVSYSSAKAGLRGISEALRRELKGTPVAVTYIAPRAVATGLSRGAVLEFAKLSKMKLDDPEQVSARIVDAIIARRKDVYLGLPENFFIRLNAMMPRLVDAALAGGDRKAKHLFAPSGSKD